MIETATGIGTTAATTAAANPDKTAQVVTALAETPQSILKPLGELVGKAGSKPTIREMSGGVNAARSMFGRLTSSGAKPRFAPGYKGFLYNLPNGGTVGWRTVMSRSPNTQVTIDINIPNVLINGKLKF